MEEFKPLKIFKKFENEDEKWQRKTEDFSTWPKYFNLYNFWLSVIFDLIAGKFGLLICKDQTNHHSPWIPCDPSRKIVAVNSVSGRRNNHSLFMKNYSMNSSGIWSLSKDDGSHVFHFFFGFIVIIIIFGRTVKLTMQIAVQTFQFFIDSAFFLVQNGTWKS